MTKLIAVLGTFGLSFSSIFVRFADADSLVLAFYRMVFAAILLTPFLLLQCASEYKKLSIKEFVLCLLSGICFGMHLRFIFLAFRTTTIASATVLVNTEVFFVAIGSFIIHKTAVKKEQLCGILIVFSGSLIIAMSDAGGSGSGLFGDCLALLAAVCSAAYTLIGKRCRRNITTKAYTGLVYFAAMITLGLSVKRAGIPFTGYRPINYLIALGLALICTYLGHSLFSWSLKYESASYVSLVKLLEPAFASIMAIVFFREYPKALTLAGAILVIAGIAWYIKHETDADTGDLT